MALHYQQAIQVNSGCPAIIAVGPSETGKSTSIKCPLCPMGMLFSVMVRVLGLGFCVFVCMCVSEILAECPTTC